MFLNSTSSAHSTKPTVQTMGKTGKGSVCLQNGIRMQVSLLVTVLDAKSNNDHTKQHELMSNVYDQGVIPSLCLCASWTGEQNEHLSARGLAVSGTNVYFATGYCMQLARNQIHILSGLPSVGDV